MDNFQESFRKNINRSLELGIKEPVYRWGPVKITWRPDSGTGQIDIIETKGLDFYKLKEFWEQVRLELPEAKWELNPDKPIKDRIYAMMFKDDPQVSRSGDKGMQAKGREGFILDNRKFNVNNLGETELRRFAENWLTNNPGKTLREFKKENGYNGPALKTKQRKGQPIRVSFKDVEKAKLYQQNRLNRIQPKTESEAAYVKNIQKEASVRSDDLLHHLTYEGKPSVAEHNLRGDNEAMSISNPNFAGRKTEIETKARKKGWLTGLDNVTGEIVIAPEGTFNKHDPSSSLGAIVISEGDDIATIIGKLPSSAEAVGNITNPINKALGINNDARLARLVGDMTDFAKGIPPGARFGMSILPGIGIAGDTFDAAIKHQEAIDDPTLLNRAQDWVAKSVATTSVIPSPTAQAYNFGAGLLLGGSDLVEHFGEKVVRSIGGAPQWFIDKFKEKQQLGYQDRVLNHPYHDNTNTSTTPD
jgi:hypothetical protein